MMNLLKNLVTNLIIYTFSCFPIKNKKIVLFSYYGNQYGCNPKYISQYIQENYPADKFDVVWVFNDLSSKKYLSDIRTVKTMSLKYFYELYTAKVVITNYRTTELFKKRKNQYYIQTWHSSLRLKQIEKDAEQTLPPRYIQMAKEDSLKCDLLLSGSSFSSEVFKRSFWYDGEIFEHGTPRNDVLFRNSNFKKKEVLEKLKLSSNTNILLYAPTFRKGNSLSACDLNFEKLLETLTAKYGGDWTILVKLHPHINSNFYEGASNENVLDVSSFDDIQELLLIADILISDYSSLMFDYSITSRPCFLFVPDLFEYISKDRGLYFDLTELPFISALNQIELEEEIKRFNSEKYKNELDVFLKRVGTFENGDACEMLVKRLDEVCFKKTRSENDEAV